MSTIAACKIRFHLFRGKQEKPTELFSNRYKLLLKSGFSVKKETKIIIHGWMEDMHGKGIQAILKAYLQTESCNIIVVDWKEISCTDYAFVKTHITTIAKYIADFVKFLENCGLNIDHLHVIGYSFGAHVAGCIGRKFGGRVSRITGLDPALRMFHNNDPHLIKETDAKFVDVIHTNGGVLGIEFQLGTVDFYPNGGCGSQPDAEEADRSLKGESHLRSCLYFAESILNERAFLSAKCQNWADYQKGAYIDQKEQPMGEHVCNKTILSEN